jgi:hypothetical protein
MVKPGRNLTYPITDCTRNTPFSVSRRSTKRLIDPPSVYNLQSTVNLRKGQPKVSKSLINDVIQFIRSSDSADDFSIAFILKWKAERDNGQLLADAENESTFLSSAFCLADLYNPSENRKEYEFDEFGLREKLRSLASEYSIDIDSTLYPDEPKTA